MIAIYLGIIGFLAFLLGVIGLGIWLRRHPPKENAEKSSRVLHFLFFAGLGAPFLVALVSPGLTRLDGLAGWRPLPWRPFFIILGILLAIPGLYFLAVSNKLLRALGSGANAFRLTKRVVAQDIYQYTRNPMSLGYYLFGLSIAFITASRLLAAAVLLGIIPAHLLFLKFFEEKELELRFGEPYLRYRRSVPFLIPRLAMEEK
jgi:protein-S-isoprenylcysteine O-methyltransferase Ste14